MEVLLPAITALTFRSGCSKFLRVHKNKFEFKMEDSLLKDRDEVYRIHTTENGQIITDMGKTSAYLVSISEYTEQSVFSNKYATRIMNLYGLRNVDNAIVSDIELYEDIRKQVRRYRKGIFCLCATLV